MFSLFKRNDVVDEFSGQLRDKYDEDFIIEEIFNILYTDSGKGFQVVACPVNDPTLKFNAYMTNEFSFPYDTYLCALMKDKIQEEIIRMADIYFFGEFWLQAIPDTSSFESAINVREKNKYIGVREFFKEGKEELHLSIELYIKSYAEPDCRLEAERLFHFSEEVITFGIHNCEILVYYVKPDEFEDMMIDYERYIQDKKEYQELFGKDHVPEANIYMHFPENFTNVESFRHMYVNAFTDTYIAIHQSKLDSTLEEIQTSLMEGMYAKKEV